MIAVIHGLYNAEKDTRAAVSELRGDVTKSIQEQNERLVHSEDVLLLGTDIIQLKEKVVVLEKGIDLSATNLQLVNKHLQENIEKVKESLENIKAHTVQETDTLASNITDSFEANKKQIETLQFQQSMMFLGMVIMAGASSSPASLESSTSLSSSAAGFMQR